MNEQQLNALAESVKALASQVKIVRDSQMRALVASKVKELGIPDWRVKEGFNIDENASDEDVVRKLKEVAEHINDPANKNPRATPPTPQDKPLRLKGSPFEGFRDYAQHSEQEQKQVLDSIIEHFSVEHSR